MAALNELSLNSLVARLRDGATTSTAIVEDCLARVAAREPVVGAWQHLDPDGARAQAARRDDEAPNSRLHGIPIGLKDIIDTADMPTAYGSPIYADHRPKEDAICVQRLRAAGTVILGKTVTTEFAHRHPGKTTNPHNSAFSPGGSSSGSAAAVADRMVPLAFGTQTGGSVIRPAAYCGIVGFKPSYDWTDFTGIKHLASTFDTLGYYVRSLDDLPIVHDILGSQQLPGAETDDQTAPAFALCRTPAWSKAEPAAQALLEDVAKRLSAAGAAVRDLDLPPPFARIYDAHTIIGQFETARHLAREAAEHWDMLSDAAQSTIEKGRGQDADRVSRARHTLDGYRKEFARLLGDDVIVTLSAPGEAPKGLDFTGDAEFNRFWTSLYVPCLHLPVDTGPQGLPLGVTLAARIGHEARVVSAGRWAAAKLGLPLFG
jgi:Asp-tRNA(Asn)/Glu-tRNA(Gln) amidotransferase A subunit family amidase